MLLLAKSPDNSHAGEVFPGDAHDSVQTPLHLLKQRNAHQHNAEHDYRQNRNNHHKNKGGLYVHRKSHNHCAEYNER